MRWLLSENPTHVKAKTQAQVHPVTERIASSKIEHVPGPTVEARLAILIIEESNGASWADTLPMFQERLPSVVQPSCTKHST